MARILIIEDDEGVREFLADVLDGEGYQVTVATDGNEGGTILGEQEIDLVITDILMPHKDGIETIAELRQCSPGLKIIAISGGGRVGPENYLESAKTLGATATLAKPFSRSELLHEVEAALAVSQVDAEAH